MTTIYVPHLIKSAEQAEALPIGTVATLSEDIGDGVVDFYAASKATDGWERTDSSGPSWMSPAPAAGMVGWTALVPVEAEEEWGVEFCEDGDPDDTHVARAVSRENAEWRLSRWTPDGPGWARIVQRTAATPWEAQS